MMRRGVFGGTFDPPHVGHMMFAEVAREALRLDVVEFIPAGEPPHKDASGVSFAAQRADLVAEAIATFPHFRLSMIEMQRQGPSYTVDTLRDLKSRYPQDELFLLVGADMLADFPTWHKAEEIVSLACMIVAPRAGVDLFATMACVQKQFAKMNLAVLDMPELDISSRWIRERLAQGLRVDPILPSSVLQLIQTKGMYAR